MANTIVKSILGKADLCKRLNNIYWDAIFWWMVIVFLPLLLAIAKLFLSFPGTSLLDMIPKWNDEWSWYTQIQAVIQYGRPLGYYGYNGTHAAIGTFGPWGILPLLPYALWGKLFGWELYSPVLANLTFCCLANLAFLILTKPRYCDLKYIVGMIPFLHISALYSMTGMTESLRYSFTLVIFSMLYAIITRSTPRWFRYGVVPLFLLFGTGVYLILALALPIYIYFCCRRFHPSWRIILSVAGTAVVAWGYRLFSWQISAPYVDGTLKMLMQELENGIFGGIRAAIHTFMANMNQSDLLSFLTVMEESRLAGYFRITYWVTLLFLVLVVVKEGKRITAEWRHIHKKFNLYTISQRLFQTKGMELAGCYLLIGFLFGYAALYTSVSATLTRGLNAGFMVVALFCGIHKDKKLWAIVMTFSVLSSFAAWQHINNSLDGRLQNEQWRANQASQQKLVATVFPVLPENEAWENTVATYGLTYNTALLLPAGAGRNNMLDGSPNQKAGYVMIDKGQPGWEEHLGKNKNAGHAVLVENDQFVLLKNVKGASLQ